MCVPLGSYLKVSFSVAACPFLELCAFAVTGVRLPGHFEVWNVVLRDTFSSAWQVWYFVRVAKALAGLYQNQRWLRRSCFMAKYLANLDDAKKKA